MPIRQIGIGGGSVIGGTAIDWFRARVCLSALNIYLETNGRMMASRNATPANLRAIASEYTGKTYARSRKGLEKAHADLTLYMKTDHADELARG